VGLFGRDAPIPAYRFAVEIDGILSDGWFTSMSGLGVTRETEEVPQGGVNTYVHKLAGRYKYTDITLKQGIFPGESDLWKWMMAFDYRWFFYDYEVDRTSISIVQYGMQSLGLFGYSPDVVRTWTLYEAFPVGYKLGDLDSSSNDVAIDELTITYHYLEMSTGWSLF